MSTKQQLLNGLLQLEKIVVKLPPTIFNQSLCDDMLPLKTQILITINFAYRGYLPLVQQEVHILEAFPESNNAVLKKRLIEEIQSGIKLISAAKDVLLLDNDKKINDRAGLNSIKLGQSDYIHAFILPNFYFHLSMVYAIARQSGVDLSKGDYDGIHQY